MSVDADRSGDARALFEACLIGHRPDLLPAAFALRRQLPDESSAERSYLEQAIALVARRSGDIAAADAHSSAALRAARLSGDQVALGHALTTRVSLLSVVGPEGEFRRCIRVALDHTEGVTRVRLWGTIAVAELERRNLDDAERAMSHVDGEHVGALAAGFRNNRGVLHLLQGSLARAASQFELVVADDNADQTLRSLAQCNLALVDLALGLPHAGERFNESLSTLGTRGVDLAWAELDRCGLLIELGLVDQAVQLGLRFLLGHANRAPERALALLDLLKALALGGDQASLEAVRDAVDAKLLGTNAALAATSELFRWADDCRAGIGAVAPSVADVPSLIRCAVSDDLAAAGCVEAARQLLSEPDDNPAFSLVRDAFRSSCTDTATTLDALDRAVQVGRELNSKDRATLGMFAGRIERAALRAAVRSGDASGCIAAVRAGASLSRLDQRTPDLFGDSDTTIVVLRLVDGRCFGVVHCDARTELFDLGASARLLEVIDAVDRHTGEFLLRPSAAGRIRVRWESATERLDRLLVAPLQLAERRPVLIVPGPEFAPVPWHVLPSFVGREVRISNTVDVSPAPRFDRNASIHLVGGSRLRHVRSELRAISEIWRQEETGISATISDVVSRGPADIVHVAAHGTLRADTPALSHVQLQDAPMTLGDLSRLPEHPTLMVLAACHLGGPSTRSVLPLVNLMAGRGCDSVIVSRTAVSDREAVPFMTELHQRLADGNSTTSALAASHRSAIERRAFGCLGFIEVALPMGPRRPETDHASRRDHRSTND